MANKVTSMQILRMIIQMLDRETSERRISKQLNISRNTVKYYREQLHLSSRTYKELQSLDVAGLSAILYADSSSLQPEPLITKHRKYYSKHSTRWIVFVLFKYFEGGR